MRAGRASDLEALFELWRGEPRAGRQDSAPNEERLRRMLSRFDWPARSRVVEAGAGRIGGAVLVTSRTSPIGAIANLHVAGEPEVTLEPVRWGVSFCRAAGAAAVQCFIGSGHGAVLQAAGMEHVRPWWRMDLDLAAGSPDPEPVAGYELLDANLAEPGAWEELFNRSFADHWRFAPRSEEELLAGKLPHLCLMAVAGTRRAPAAIALGDLESYRDDPRPQPVGVVSAVGTVPEHRRRGLATWIVAEILVRLRQAGARSSSLYVDGKNAMHAAEIYEKLGYAVAFEAEVWEATFP